MILTVFVFQLHRHSENGAVIARCSQPEVGWFYWRCEDDEIYLQTLGNVVELSNPVQKVVKETLNSESNSSDVACGENSNTTNISTSGICQAFCFCFAL